MSDPSERASETQVSAWLGSQAHVTIPPEVAARVQEAIAAEASSRVGGAAVDLGAARRSAAGRYAGRRQPRVGRWLVAASVAAVAALGALVVPPLLDGRSDLLAGGDDSADAAGAESGVAAQSAPEQESSEQQQDDRGVTADLDDQDRIASLPPVPDDLVGLVVGVSPAPEAAPGCGDALAIAVDGTVLASADVDPQPGVVRDGVVLLVDEGMADAVWWVASCDSGPDQALGRSPGMPPP